jgi:AbrB family looped-hinge helix DNA binding protein
MVRKSHTAKITSKGQVTIPQDLRRDLGLRTGDRIEFVKRKHEMVVRRVKSRENSFKKYEGILKGTFPGGLKEINAWIRDLRGPL